MKNQADLCRIWFEELDAYQYFGVSEIITKPAFLTSFMSASTVIFTQVIFRALL
jgi:hypothetical protein